MTLQEILSQGVEFRYSLLDRMSQDCKYYLTFGEYQPCVLWAKNAIEHIKIMYAIWESFPADKKPEWLTIKQLNKYRDDMILLQHLEMV